MIQRKNAGFTAVELLVTLIVATVFIIAFYQLYTVATNDTHDARIRSRANNLAYEALRTLSLQVPTKSCNVINTPNPALTLPTNVDLPEPYSISGRVDCPYGTTGDKTSRIIVEIKYGNPTETVQHVTYKYKDGV